MSNRLAERAWMWTYGRAPEAARQILRDLLPKRRAYDKDLVLEVERYGLQWALRPSDYFQWHHFFGLEDVVLRTLASAAREGMVVLDVGANVGVYGIVVAERVGASGRVFCFEPNPSTASHLRQHVMLNDVANLEVVEKGVGDAITELGLDDGGSQDSGKFSFRDAEHATGPVVPVVTLDSFIAEREIDRVDLLKVDVEGFEPEVLRGARALFERDRPLLVIELSPQWYGDKLERAVAEVRRLLDLGYTFYRLLDYSADHATEVDAVELVNQRTAQFNLLAAPSEYEAIGDVLAG